METPAEFRLGKPEIGHNALQHFLQLPRIIGSAVGQRDPSLVPHPFVRVEFRSVRWQRFEVNSLAAAQKGSHSVYLVTEIVVPDHDNEIPQMLEQMARNAATSTLSKLASVRQRK